MQTGTAAPTLAPSRRHDHMMSQGNRPATSRRATMPIEAQEEVAKLLEEISAANGNKDAEQTLFELVYDELKKIAHGRLTIERPDHSWGTTELVHEVYVRLVKDPRVFSKNRRYFFGSAARAMRQLLREHARRRQTQPDGHVGGDALVDAIADEVEQAFGDNLIDVMEALDELETTVKHGKRRHDVVWLRFWNGWTYPEIADHLNVCVATVERDWHVAQAWLYRRLKGRSLDA
jgi:RNA polymerase sigma factor (TIGR02999 family)